MINDNIIKFHKFSQTLRCYNDEYSNFIKIKVIEELLKQLQQKNIDNIINKKK